MKKDPSNTAIFIFALYPNIDAPGYTHNLYSLIAYIRNYGYEPFIVSNHKELIEDSNLFIDVTNKLPMEATKEFWKEHNFFLLDDMVYNQEEVEYMLKKASAPCFFKTAENYRSLGMYLKNKGEDWISWLAGFLKTELPLVHYNIMILPKSHRLELPEPEKKTCENTTL